MAADQVTAVKHALLASQYAALAERTRFPVDVLQQLAETTGYDLAAVEREIDRAMKAVSDAVVAEGERQMLGGWAGGGKVERLRHMSEPRGTINAPRGLVTTCVA